jgi:hypothetical protein
MINKEQTETKSASKTNGDADKAEAPGLAGKAHEAAEQARSVAADRVHSARQRADSAKAQAAERVRKVGTAFRKVGEHLRVEDQFYMADRAADAGQRIEGVADYIASAELTTLVRDAEDAARRNPALIFGGTFLAGIIAGRFLKSTSPSAEAAVGSSGAEHSSVTRHATSEAHGSNNPAQASASARSGTHDVRGSNNPAQGSASARAGAPEARGANPTQTATWPRNGASDTTGGARR